MDSDTEASEPAPAQIAVPDQFGLIWEGSVRDRPSFLWAKAAALEGLRVVCETTEGLLEGVITSPGRRSATGQIIVLGGAYRSFPNHVEERAGIFFQGNHSFVHAQPVQAGYQGRDMLSQTLPPLPGFVHCSGWGAAGLGYSLGRPQFASVIGGIID